MVQIKSIIALQQVSLLYTEKDLIMRRFTGVLISPTGCQSTLLKNLLLRSIYFFFRKAKLLIFKQDCNATQQIHNKSKQLKKTIFIRFSELNNTLCMCSIKMQ